jgi:hypothetical protein
MVQSVQSGVWTGPGLPHAVQSACLTWTDQSSGHLGLDGLQATQAPELHSKILCKIMRFSNASGLLLGGSGANQIDSRRVLVNYLQLLVQIWILLRGFRWQLGWDGAVKERDPMGGDGEEC